MNVNNDEILPKKKQISFELRTVEKSQRKKNVPCFDDWFTVESIRTATIHNNLQQIFFFLFVNTRSAIFVFFFVEQTMTSSHFYLYILNVSFCGRK